MKITKIVNTTLAACALMTALSFAPSLRAADHGDAPALAQDQGADIADVYAFMDPNSAGGNSDVVLIATIHGFITPGEAVNFGVFDPNIRYRFEIFNDHVNLASPIFDSSAKPAAKAQFLAKIKPNRTIDVTFSPRAALADGTGNPPNSSLPDEVRRPSPQTATVTLGGFAGLSNHGKFTQGTPIGGSTVGPLTTTPPTLGATAAPQISYNIDVKTETQIQFFAGIVDDPFFFDIPAFSAFIESIRKGAPDTSVFNRGRDSFAGYNVLAIALKFPKALLTNSDSSKTIIGADFLTQRHASAMATSNGLAGVGAFKTIDREGNPAINVALVPFNLKNAYNGGTAKQDAELKFAGTAAKPGIVQVLAALGVTPDKGAFGVLANIALAHGDILQLDTSIPNTGPGGGNNAQTGFGTFLGVGGGASGGGGRRLNDDIIDTVLTVVAGGTLGDNTPNDEDGFVPTDAFPFLHTPHQPLPRIGTPDTNVDDGTRN